MLKPLICAGPAVASGCDSCMSTMESSTGCDEAVGGEAVGSKGEGGCGEGGGGCEGGVGEGEGGVGGCGVGGEAGGSGGAAPQLTATCATAASPWFPLPRMYLKANDGEWTSTVACFHALP